MSMTGYGRAAATLDGRSLTVEIKGVNHRFLDISLRIPRALSFLEEEARKIIAEKLARGHVDVTLSYQNLRSDAREVRLDAALADQYRAALVSMNDRLGLEKDAGLDRICEFSDVLTVTEADEDETVLRHLLHQAAGEALNKLTRMRASEGQHMQNARRNILPEIEEQSHLSDSRYPETVQEYAKRLNERLSELLKERVDPARIAQEVAIMADKAAVDEETVRLRSHIQHARELCQQTQPVGRSLDFLVQEMNREVNTISSKSLDLPITRACLDCKGAIEKLREQLQNIE